MTAADCVGRRRIARPTSARYASNAGAELAVDSDVIVSDMVASN
jgi:hypothetical protein